jgi:riboflavin biosynthesis pyrimidine reductase
VTTIELKPIWMRGLIPSPEKLDFGALVEELFRAPPQGEAPYVACNFVSTLDGRATVRGSTAALGFHTDARVVMRLRTFADAVVIGAGTMRVERYDRMLPVPRLRGYREQIGLPADPLTVIVTNSMELPWDAGLFTEGGGEVVLVTASTAKPPPTETAVEVLRHDDVVDFADLLRHLHRERGVSTTLCEGGPTVLNELIKADLADDLFLTLNPLLVGDPERTLMAGTLDAPVGAKLSWTLEAEGELFTRWQLNRGRVEPPSIE